MPELKSHASIMTVQPANFTIVASSKSKIRTPQHMDMRVDKSGKTQVWMYDATQNKWRHIGPFNGIGPYEDK
jgi:hypothetical protein